MRMPNSVLVGMLEADHHSTADILEKAASEVDLFA